MDATAATSPNVCPERLARSFAEAVAARWRGEAGGAAFERWLESHWSPEPTPEPLDPPAAVSLLGGLPAVRWYQFEDAVVGFAHGRRGCWWVPAPASSAV